MRRQLDAYTHARGNESFTDRLATSAQQHQEEKARRQTRRNLLQGRLAETDAED